jgi:aminomethyltransferase
LANQAKAVEAMQSLSSVDLSAIKYYHFEVADFAGLDVQLYPLLVTQALAVLKFIVKNEDAETKYKVFEAGAAGIKP